MKEYIEREAVLKEIDNERESFAVLGMLGAEYVLTHHARRIIEEITAADVVERKRGEWIIKNGRIVCDQCEEILAVCPNRDQLNDILLELKEIEKFCYNCGADMRWANHEGD